MKTSISNIKGCVLLLLVIVLTSCASQRSAKMQTSNLKFQFQSILDSIYITNPESKGMMVHIEYPDKNISWSGASGYSNFEKKTKLTADQPALLASSTKTYVAATILRLVEKNITTLEMSIKNIISNTSQQLLESDGYDLESIKIKNLLSHTSGIEDYISDRNVQDHLMYVFTNKRHRWTRKEQIEKSIKVGDPLGNAGEVFKYADVNYLLLTEIIEYYTNKPFYTAMKELLKYKQLNLSSTWFYTLEDSPNSTPLAHQYFSEYNMRSYDVDPSWDLYGGGGIAATTQDLAKFSYYYFNGLIVENKNVRNLIFTQFDVAENNKIVGSPILNYHLGLVEGNYATFTSYGHGGFWGTNVQYFPKLNCSIAVFILDRDALSQSKIIYEELLEELVRL